MRARSGPSSLRALLFAVGLATIGVGAALTLRPFSSLDALTVLVAASLILAEVSELLGGAETDSPGSDRVAGALLLATGLLAALVPGLTVRGIATVAGIARQ
jgi:uncharacterized membrane protein HdeD (DUF308 family)